MMMKQPDRQIGSRKKKKQTPMIPTAYPNAKPKLFVLPCRHSLDSTTKQW